MTNIQNPTLTFENGTDPETYETNLRTLHEIVDTFPNLNANEGDIVDLGDNRAYLYVDEGGALLDVDLLLTTAGAFRVPEGVFGFGTNVDFTPEVASKFFKVIEAPDFSNREARAVNGFFKITPEELGIDPTTVNSMYRGGIPFKNFANDYAPKEELARGLTNARGVVRPRSS